MLLTDALAGFARPCARPRGRPRPHVRGVAAALCAVCLVAAIAGQLTHGTDFAARIASSGYAPNAAGEDIATGYPTPSAVVSAWMNSPDHCRNILDPSYRDIGTGVSAQAVPGVTALPGTWTEDFGLTLLQSAPSADWAPANGCPY